jgi:hypothetical protein
MDVCPFTNLPCGISDLCDSADSLCRGFEVVKECSFTSAEYLVREHFLHTKLCPFTDLPCKFVNCCSDAFNLLSGFYRVEDCSCPHAIVKFHK